MKIRNIIKEEIRKFIKEEFTGGKLYGYHCTPCKNLENIEHNGFKIGERAMQGEGVYAFYNLTDDSSGNAAVGYGQRHISENEFCIVKFEIEHPEWLLILIKDIAEDVLGEKADIITQITRLFKGWDESKPNGWDNYIEDLFKSVASEYRTPEFAEQHKQWLIKQFNGDIQAGSSNLMFGTSDLESKARFGVIYYGEYGIQYLIKRANIMKPIGYHNVKRVNWKLEVSDFIPFTGKSKTIKDKILSDEKYKDLATYIDKINSMEDLQKLKFEFKEKRNAARNNKDYEYYDNMYEQIDELTYTQGGKLT
jgi:hypothetical protein